MEVVAPKINSELQNYSGTGLFAEGTVHNVALTDYQIEPPQHKSASLNESNVFQTEFKAGLYDHMQMMDVVFDTCTFVGVKLPSFSAHRLVFRNCRMSGVQMNEGVLKDVVFEDCKLDISNFRYAKLNKVKFARCNLESADFLGCEVTTASMEGCNLAEAHFSQCKVKELDLRGSELMDMKGLMSLKNTTINQVQLIGLAPQLASEIGLIVEND
jgi:uncharacterized protein YjbI with pentapeptide repeats